MDKDDILKTKREREFFELQRYLGQLMSENVALMQEMDKKDKEIEDYAGRNAKQERLWSDN